MTGCHFDPGCEEAGSAPQRIATLPELLSRMYIPFGVQVGVKSWRPERASSRKGDTLGGDGTNRRGSSRRAVPGLRYALDQHPHNLPTIGQMRGNFPGVYRDSQRPEPGFAPTHHSRPFSKDYPARHLRLLPNARPNSPLAVRRSLLFRKLNQQVPAISHIDCHAAELGHPGQFLRCRDPSMGWPDYHRRKSASAVRESATSEGDRHSYGKQGVVGMGGYGAIQPVGARHGRWVPKGLLAGWILTSFVISTLCVPGNTGRTHKERSSNCCLHDFVLSTQLCHCLFPVRPHLESVLGRSAVGAVGDDVIPFAVDFPLTVVPLAVAASRANGVVEGQVVIEIYKQTVLEGMFQSAQFTSG